MSRIYEALRRADLERETQDEQAPQLVAPPEEARGVAPVPAIANLAPEDGVKGSWAPCLEAIPALRERDEVVEQFRALRSRLAQARQEAALKTVLISSGMPSEGKSFIALNLAVSLARANRNRVLLIDGDLRRPTLHHWLGAADKPGLSDYLNGTVEQSEILQRNDVSSFGNTQLSGFANLRFIASGTCTSDSSELITNNRLESLFDSLSQQFDWILVDSPPILAVPDAVDLARIADGILLVTREGKTLYQVIQRAQAAFHQFRVLGVVLNAAKDANVKKYYYSSYYRSYYAEPASNEGNEFKKKVRSKK